MELGVTNAGHRPSTDNITLSPGLGSHLLEIIPWLENSKVEEIDARASPRYLKTHSPYNHVAYDKSVSCKYIYVSRNPKDACVSLYHHARGFAVSVSENMACTPLTLHDAVFSEKFKVQI